MSRIYFHTPDATAEVRGSERAYVGNFLNDLLWAALWIDRDSDTHRILPFLPEGCYLRRSRLDVHSVKVWLSAGMDRQGITFPSDCPVAPGVSIEPFVLALNTGLALGNDVVRLMARLHGQCEIHAWVNGRNREWLARIIEEGRETNLLREGAGWESVVELLRADKKQPVVTSYSVCEQFPNSSIAQWRDKNDGDDWYDLPDDRKWSLAMKHLKREGDLELRPDRWRYPELHFGPKVSGFDLRKALWEWSKPVIGEAGQPAA